MSTIFLILVLIGFARLMRNSNLREKYGEA